MAPKWITCLIFVVRVLHASSIKLPDTEINALLDIYDATRGDFWSDTKWNKSHIENGQICSLPQYNSTITCYQDYWTLKLHTKSITFINNALNGTIPSSIGNLNHLHSFIIRYEASLYGIIPDEICQLKYLEVLEFSDTNINGTIPACIHHLDKLRELILDTNPFLTGKVPFESICDIANLYTLKLLRSPLLSPFFIPYCISNLKQLTSLQLNNVSLYDGLFHLCDAVSLEVLIIKNIYTLNSIIPDCIGSLTQLRIFKLVSCPMLRGSVPNTICNWTNVEFININIYANINDAIAENYNDTTRFRSVLPKCIGDMRWLTMINIAHSGFFGTIPRGICRCSKLEVIRFDDNAFNGSIPDCVGPNMSHLQILQLDHNKLMGSIPSTICAATQLKEIWMNHNHLQGTIPDCVFNSDEMQHLVSLSAGNNELSGRIPKYPSQLVNLSLYSNHFEGRFPAITNNITTLLLLDENEFSGTLDDIFFTHNITLHSLKWLTLDSNNFYSQNIEHVLRKVLDESGDIIKTLTLYNNPNIHGQMPEYLSSQPKYLPHLHHFNIHKCDLSGSIPQNWRFNELRSYTVHSNRLSCAIPTNLVNLTAQTAYEQINNITRQTIVVLGNYLRYYSDPNLVDDVLPTWIISPFKRYRATNLYIGFYDIVRNYVVIIMCAICLLALLIMMMIHTVYAKIHSSTHSNFNRVRVRAKTLWFEFRRIPNIGFRFINWKYVISMMFLASVYKCNSTNYFLCTTWITSFDLAYYSVIHRASNPQQYNMTVLFMDGFLCGLWIIASTILCHIVCEICIENRTGTIDNVGNINFSPYMFSMASNPLFESWDDEDDNMDNVSLASSFSGSEDEIDDDQYNTNMDKDYNTETLPNWKKYGYFILWNVLFMIALSLILLFGVSQALPDNNVFNIRTNEREILCNSISIILTLNSCVCIPNLVDSWNILIYDEYTPKSRRGIVTLILRSVCSIVIPMISSFILLNNCGRYWIKFWNPCNDDLAHQLFSSTTASLIADSAFDLLHADSVCKPLTSYHDLNVEKCLRQYFNKWIIIWIQKLLICVILPIPIICVKWMKYQWRKWWNPRYEFIYPRIDSAYFMVFGKLEIMIIWSLIAPAIVPITLIAIQTNRFFYGAVIKHFQWKLANRAPAPVKFLCISIIIQQLLLILFASVSFQYKLNSYVLIASFVVMDSIYIIYYHRATDKKTNHEISLIEMQLLQKPV